SLSSFKSVSSHNEPIGALEIIPMRRISTVAVALILGASHASAADLPVRTGPPAYYPVATVYDWGGGYIGINGGSTFGPSELDPDWRKTSGNRSTRGFHFNCGLVSAENGGIGQGGA